MWKALERLKFRYQQVGNRLFNLLKEGRNVGFLACALHNYHLALQVLYCTFVTGGHVKNSVGCMFRKHEDHVVSL